MSPASFYFSQDSASCFISFQPGFRFLHSTSARAAPWSPFPLQLCILLRLRGSVPSSASCCSSPHASSASSPCFIMLTAPLLSMGPVWFSLPQLRLIISVFFLFSFTLSLHLLITPSHHLHYNTFGVSLGPINRLLLLCSWCSSLSHHGICIPVSLSFFIHIRFFSVSHFGDRLVPLFFLFIFIFSQVSSLAGIISTASSASVHCRSSHLVSSHLISSSSHLIFSHLRLSCSVASVSTPAQHTVISATTSLPVSAPPSSHTVGAQWHYGIPCITWNSMICFIPRFHGT